MGWNLTYCSPSLAPPLTKTMPKSHSWFKSYSYVKWVFGEDLAKGWVRRGKMCYQRGYPSIYWSTLYCTAHCQGKSKQEACLHCSDYTALHCGHTTLHFDVVHFTTHLGEHCSVGTEPKLESTKSVQWDGRLCGGVKHYPSSTHPPIKHVFGTLRPDHTPTLHAFWVYYTLAK